MSSATDRLDDGIEEVTELEEVDLEEVARPGKQTDERSRLDNKGMPPPRPTRVVGPPPLPPAIATPSLPAPSAPPSSGSPRPSSPRSPVVSATRPTHRVGSHGRRRTLVAMDFGTTCCSVGALTDGQPHVLAMPSGHPDFPSIVGFREDGFIVVGHEARRLLAQDPKRAIASPKRILGRRYDDPEVEAYLAALAMEHRCASNREVTLQASGRTLSVPQLSAYLLYQLRLVAEKHLGHTVNEVLLTAPVSFDKRRYDALQEAAAIAEMDVIGFVDEPMAAAYINRSDPHFHGLVAVYDFGGGTFDFSVVNVDGGKVTMVTTAGDSWLGGDDFDDVLANAASNHFWRETTIELRHQAVEWQHLRVACEQAKRRLSLEDAADVRLERAALTRNGPVALSFSVTRAQFADLAQDLIARSLQTCREALDLSDIKPSEINAVYLSGGTSRIPAIRTALTRFFGKAPTSVVEPERAVLLGAALYAGHIQRPALHAS